MKRCAVINDISGFGRCSLTVSIPIISALGIQANPVVTGVFTNQTGYESYKFHDLTDMLPSFCEEWKKLDASFDGILTGFLLTEHQYEHIDSFIDTLIQSQAQDIRMNRLHRLKFGLDVLRSNFYIRRLERVGRVSDYYKEYRFEVLVNRVFSEEELKDGIRECFQSFYVSPYFEKKLTADLCSKNDVKSEMLTGDGAIRFMSIIAARSFAAACLMAEEEKDTSYHIRISPEKIRIFGTAAMKSNAVRDKLSDCIKNFTMLFTLAFTAAAYVAFVNVSPTLRDLDEHNCAIRLSVAEDAKDFAFVYAMAQAIIRSFQFFGEKT